MKNEIKSKMKSQIICKTLLITSTLVLSMVANISHAGNGCVNGKTIFSCTTKANKVIKVCESGNYLTYTYGRTGKTELTLKREMADVIKRPWSGVSRSIFYSIGFKSGKTRYNVFADKERNQGGNHSAGVEVVHQEKDTLVHCKNTNIIDNMNDILH